MGWKGGGHALEPGRVPEPLRSPLAKRVWIAGERGPTGRIGMGRMSERHLDRRMQVAAERDGLGRLA
jgi:hypothetical protein